MTQQILKNRSGGKNRIRLILCVNENRERQVIKVVTDHA